MERSRIIRFFKIGWTAICVIACVALVALWMRSYWYWDVLEKKTSTRLFQFGSLKGRLVLEEHHPGSNRPIPASVLSDILDDISLGRRFVSRPVSDLQGFADAKGIVGFARYDRRSTKITLAPYWFPVVLAATFAAVPWIPRRFSLRTLLVATTVVALLLGLIAASMRKE